jgi:predicted Zn-dependent protease with MMP-like domain
MPLSDWLRGRRSGPARRVRQALTLSRDGDVTAAVEMIAERFPEALDELRALGEAVDAGWLRLATALEFRSGRMLEGHATAERALAIDEDPQTWHLLGRLRTWLGRADATDAFRRAALMDPAEFFLPYRVTRQQFAALAEQAFTAIPAQFRDRLDNTLVVVDDLPELDAVREGEDPDVLGVYDGATAMDRGLPERIVLYQRNHEQVAANVTELTEEVNQTMRHEIGHHFGMEEDELPY